MADDPGGQHGRRAFCRSEWESKNIDRSEAIVASWFYIVEGCRRIEQGVSKHLGVGRGDAKNRRKHMSFMLAFAMQRIQHVVFKFDTKIGSFAVGKLHASDCAPFTAAIKRQTVRQVRASALTRLGNVPLRIMGRIGQFVSVGGRRVVLSEAAQRRVKWDLISIQRVE